MQELNPQEQATQDVETVKEELVAANPKLELNPRSYPCKWQENQ